MNLNIVKINNYKYSKGTHYANHNFAGEEDACR